MLVSQRWETVSTDSLAELGDFKGYQSSFLRLFGFGLIGVDYSADTDPNVRIPSLSLRPITNSKGKKLLAARLASAYLTWSPPSAFAKFLPRRYRPEFPARVHPSGIVPLPPPSLPNSNNLQTTLSTT